MGIVLFGFMFDLVSGTKRMLQFQGRLQWKDWNYITSILLSKLPQQSYRDPFSNQQLTCLQGYGPSVRCPLV
jgi:hypothetical protein